MKAHHLMVLAVVAVAALVFALWSSSVHDPETSLAHSGMLVPELAAHVNEVSGIVVSDDERTVTLSRDEAGWSIAELAGYPADSGKVRGFLLRLADAALIEQKTSDPEKYATLGVADPGVSEDNEGVAVHLDVPLGSAAGYDLLLGKLARGTTATYARRPGEAESWLASEDLSVAADPMTWVERQIMDVQANEIQQVTITHPDGEVLGISKAAREATNFEVANLPEDAELRYASIANPIASALSSLRLEDVAAIAARDPAERDSVVTRFVTFSGLVVEARAFAEDEKSWAHFSASFDEAQALRFAETPNAREDASGSEAGEDSEAVSSGDDAPASPDTDTAPEAAEEAAESAAAAPDFTAVRERARELDARLRPWVYAVSSYKYEQMARRLADLLKEPDAS